MPELPEVQTIINGLRQTVMSKTISSIMEKRQGTLIFGEDINICEFGKIESIERRGKYIIIKTSKDLKLVIHLRMTGKLIYEEDINNSSAYSRAEIIFSDKAKLIFDDVRTFGKIQILMINEKIKSIEKLGVEPLSNKFDVKYLENKLKKRKAPIKNSLLDQTVIAGLGNIYVAEILFRAKVHPVIPANRIGTVKLKNIVSETKSVLMEAIKYNGTTISDYRSVENKTGEFQNFLKVYGKKTCECGAEIMKIKQAGRSTYFCEKCQR